MSSSVMLHLLAKDADSCAFLWYALSCRVLPRVGEAVRLHGIELFRVTNVTHEYDAPWHVTLFVDGVRTYDEYVRDGWKASFEEAAAECIKRIQKTARQSQGFGVLR